MFAGAANRKQVAPHIQHLKSQISKGFSSAAGAAPNSRRRMPAAARSKARERQPGNARGFQHGKAGGRRWQFHRGFERINGDAAAEDADSGNRAATRRRNRTTIGVPPVQQVNGIQRTKLHHYNHARIGVNYEIRQIFYSFLQTGCRNGLVAAMLPCRWISRSSVPNLTHTCFAR